MNTRGWRLFACMAALAGAAACDPADRIRDGLRESDVLEILGKPTRTVEDAAKFRDELTPSLAASLRLSGSSSTTCPTVVASVSCSAPTVRLRPS